MAVAENGIQLAKMYRVVLQELLAADKVESVASPMSIGSGWGTSPRGFRELVPLVFSIDTDEVLLESCSRPLSREYALLSSAWILLGRNDVESVDRVNPRASLFSLDGFTLSGAFGYRLRTRHGDQLAAAIDMLKKDPTTRRATAFIGEASDVLEEGRDFPCASLVQFYVRSGKLRSVVSMRSQSFFGVFPYDLVNFRYIQNYVADQLGIRAGRIDFICSSAHVYDEEEERITAFIQSDFQFAPLPRLSWDTLREDFFP